jgi:hypothetical protein
MHADAVDHHRPPVVVVGRVGLALHVEGGVEAGRKTRGIVALPNIFGSIVQPAIADQKIEPASGENSRCTARRIESSWNFIATDLEKLIRVAES